jgi:hypothetical protein
MSGIALLLLDARMTRASPGGEGHPRDVDNAGSRAVHQSCEGIIVMLKQKSSEYRGYRTAGIRLSEEQLPQLAQLYGARTKPMLPAVHAFDKAHTVMLVEEGLLERRQVRRYCAACDSWKARAWSRPARASAAACTPASNT